MQQATTATPDAPCRALAAQHDYPVRRWAGRVTEAKLATQARLWGGVDKMPDRLHDCRVLRHASIHETD